MVNYFLRLSVDISTGKGWLSQFKLTWKVSKAAIIYRAHQLSLLTDAQYKTAFFGLKRKGEAIDEKEDLLIAHEQPELFYRAMTYLLKDLAVDTETLARRLAITPAMLADLVNDPALAALSFPAAAENVVSLSGWRIKTA